MANDTVNGHIDGHVDGNEAPFLEKPAFEVTFPQRNNQDDVSQDAEVFDVVVKQRIRIHDYDTLYAYPKLYDHVIEDVLQCQSPQKLVGLLRKQLYSESSTLPREPLRILDVAAGNGRVGAELRNQLGEYPGIESLIGTDLLDSARVATLRDRKPDPYSDFVVADVLDSDQPSIKQWRKEPFDVVTVCAALGPGEGDLPLEVLDAAITFLNKDGLLVFTVNEGQKQSCCGRYTEFLDSLREEGKTHWGSMIKIDRLAYKHRLSVRGDWIEYTALVYEKVAEG